MPNYDLTNIDPSLIQAITPGAHDLINAVQVANPSLTPPQAAKVANVVLVETSQQLINGKQLAFVGQNPNGDREISIIGIEIK